MLRGGQTRSTCKYHGCVIKQDYNLERENVEYWCYLKFKQFKNSERLNQEKLSKIDCCGFFL